jgi:hypothetical protein
LLQNEPALRNACHHRSVDRVSILDFPRRLTRKEAYVFWRKKLTLVVALAAVSGVSVWSMAGAGPSTAEPGQGMVRGRVELRSVGALELGPGNVLFVGDSEAARVVALEVDIPEASGEPYESIEDLDQRIGAMLGVGPRDVFVKDMAVHPESGTTFLAVMRGAGDDARALLLSVARDGTIAEVDLDEVAHSSLALDDAPAEDGMLYRTRARTLTVTDLEFIDGELYIAGLSNEEFASKLRRARFPFGGETAGTGLEIYHGAHGEYETFAPIYSFIPYDIAGDRHLLAGYLCTPLVTFPLDEVRSTPRLRGKTIAELGWGNWPIDLIDYEYGGDRFLLVANNQRGTMKLRADDIATAQKGAGITSEAEPRTGVDYQTVPLGNVAQVSDLDPENILVLGRSMENGALVLSVRPKRWL